MPCETRRYQRINYKVLNKFGHRSVGLDEHMNNEVSSETDNFTCEELANIYNELFAHIKTEEKKYVGTAMSKFV
jgi:hypothetical protein